MKLKYGGHWGGADVAEFEIDQEYDLTIEQLDDLTNRFAVKINLVKVVDPVKNTHHFEKYFYLDVARWSFKQR